MLKHKILFQLSGSIACFKAAAAISRLAQRGYDIQCVLTEGARQFIGPATLEGLTRHSVLNNTFEAGQALAHIDLARNTGLSVLCPASAATIARLAQGMASDLVSTVFLAHEDLTRYLVFPAMNPAMYAHPAVRRNLDILRSWGVRVVEAAAGRTACGEEGLGRLPEPEMIVDEIERCFPPSVTKRVLITSGGTTEPIDDVRVITNRSTGATAAAIADEFLAEGAEVTYLHSRHAKLPSTSTPYLTIDSFDTFSDLASRLSEDLSSHRYDVIIHAAAVSDFAVANRTKGKLSSDIQSTPGNEGEVVLRLKRNPKLADSLRSWSANKDAKIVLFKLDLRESGDEAIRKLASRGIADFIIFNTPDAIASGEQHDGELHAVTARIARRLCTFQSKTELARRLSSTLKEYLT